MEQAEEAAAESEAERDRIFRLEIEGAVVEAQFFQRVAQQAVFVRFDRYKAPRTPSASAARIQAEAPMRDWRHRRSCRRSARRKRS